MPTDQSVKLRLDLVNVSGKRLGGKVDIRLRHQVLSDFQVFNGLDATKKILISGLFGAPQGLYKIEVDPSTYLLVSQFVNLKASGITELQIAFPVDYKKVKSVVFQPFSQLSPDLQSLLQRSAQVLLFEGLSGEELYKALDDVRKAGLLNIIAKCGATPLTNGKTVLSYIDRITELRGDRFFAVVPRELRQETKNSAVAGLFRSAPEVLHSPPPGFTHAGSFKTLDQYGNLQLTFFLNGDVCMADIDIDDAAGLEHLFQVIEHSVTGKQTHPYNIHEILVAHQKIDPGYQFVV